LQYILLYKAICRGKQDPYPLFYYHKKFLFLLLQDPLIFHGDLAFSLPELFFPLPRRERVRVRVIPAKIPLPLSLPQEVGEGRRAKTWMPDKSAQA